MWVDPIHAELVVARFGDYWRVQSRIIWAAGIGTHMAVACPNQRSRCESGRGLSHVNSPPTQPWFAVQVMGHREKIAHDFLLARGYESFLPIYRCRRHWSDRIKHLELPLFPGYIFCRFNLYNRLPILQTPGVLYIVGIGKTPAAISEEEILAVRSIVEARLPTQPWPFLQAGQKVRLNCGPLQGLDGIVLQLKSSCRLIVSVKLLQRSVATEIDSAWVERAN